MKKIKLIFVPINEITVEQKKAILKFRMECFSGLDSKEINDFFVPADQDRFGRIFASLDNEIVGGTGLFQRVINYDSKKINLGGMGGVCVLPKYQRQGFGSQIVEFAMGILKRKNCDVVILSVGLENKIYSLYEKVGFKFLKQKVTFTNSKGKKLIEDATMITPLNSHDIYEFIINNKKTFHWGKGIW